MIKHEKHIDNRTKISKKVHEGAIIQNEKPQRAEK